MFHPALTDKINNIAKAIYNQLGPGFPDRIYRESLLRELEDAEINFEIDPFVPIDYKGHTLTSGLYDCFIVEHKIVIYIKSTPDYPEKDRELMRIFLDLSEKRCGIILDFNSDRLSGLLRVFMCVQG